jgi:hypothetical protein
VRPAIRGAARKRALEQPPTVERKHFLHKRSSKNNFGASVRGLSSLLAALPKGEGSCFWTTAKRKQHAQGMSLLRRNLGVKLAWANGLINPPPKHRVSGTMIGEEKRSAVHCPPSTVREIVPMFLSSPVRIPIQRYVVVPLRNRKRLLSVLDEPAVEDRQDPRSLELESV